MELLDMLNDPITRQYAVAGGTAAIGFAYGLLGTTIDVARALHPVNLFSVADDPNYKPEPPIGSSIVTKATIIGTSAFGLEHAIRESAPLLNSYVVEAGADLASATAGFYVGKKFAEIMFYASTFLITRRRS